MTAITLAACNGIGNLGNITGGTTDLGPAGVFATEIKAIRAHAEGKTTGVVIGGGIGAVVAQKIQMPALPQLAPSRSTPR